MNFPAAAARCATRPGPNRSIIRLRGYGNWRDSWYTIVPGDFGGNGRTDLLFYDRNAGQGEFYTSDDAGGITLLKAQPGWRNT